MIIERLYSIVQGPLVSEKSASVGDGVCKQIVFKVRADAKKNEIKEAIEHLFSVQVKAVKTCSIKPKSKVFKGVSGKRSAWKKAYVCLKEGFDIDFSEAAQ